MVNIRNLQMYSKYINGDNDWKIQSRLYGLAMNHLKTQEDMESIRFDSAQDSTDIWLDDILTRIEQSRYELGRKPSYKAYSSIRYNKELLSYYIPERIIRCSLLENEGDES